jgi:sugar O-acyltransferase (sialic acid O-acetyltransferase NeuD family)
MKKKLVLAPAGGFAREALWLIRDLIKSGEKLEPVGFLDDSPELRGQNLCGIPVLGGLNWLDGKTTKVSLVVSTGFPSLKEELVKRASQMQASFATLIHPRVEKSEFVEIGEGTIICAGNIITTQVKIGKFVLVNLDCTIGHDVEVGDFSTLAPGTHISGRVKIGRGVDIGTGVNVIPKIQIGDWSVIGAGASVVRDIPANVVAVGVPARVIKARL